MSARLTLNEAVVTVLVAAVTADGAVGPIECDRLHVLLSSMPLFREVAPEQLQRLVQNALDRVSHTAEDELLPSCAAVIPGNLRASLYSLAVELVFVDGAIAESEKRFGNRLQRAFGIDDVTAMTMVEAALIKTRA